MPRELGRVLNLNQSINHMKDKVEVGHLSKFDAFRSNGHQVTDLET